MEMITMFTGSQMLVALSGLGFLLLGAVVFMAKILVVRLRQFNEDLQAIREDVEDIETPAPADLKIMPLSSDVKVPSQAFDTDAGYDVYAPDDLILQPGSEQVIPLGWCCSFNPGWAMVMKEKSGCATKDRTEVHAGVIDSAYRGEVGVFLVNRNDVPVLYSKGQKIAQFMMVAVGSGNPEIVKSLTESERGAGGYGSTGTH